MRVVLDSNIFIAAVAARGLCEAIVELCLERHSLISCKEILAEVEEKLVSKLKVPTRVVAEYMKFLRQNVELVRPGKVEFGICRDPNDLMVLGLVSPGKVQAIVTGDKDLLVLGAFEGAPIMTPRSFWEFNQSEP
ncbi:MAG: putative toxin-antitoxin system toxin component, PIN family [Terrimicrobiaceae bacterium]